MDELWKINKAIPKRFPLPSIGSEMHLYLCELREKWVVTCGEGEAIFDEYKEAQFAVSFGPTYIAEVAAQQRDEVDKQDLRCDRDFAEIMFKGLVNLGFKPEDDDGFRESIPITLDGYAIHSMGSGMIRAKSKYQKSN